MIYQAIHYKDSSFPKQSYHLHIHFPFQNLDPNDEMNQPKSCLLGQGGPMPQVSFSVALSIW